jgi:hypothetical protein
MEYPEDYLPDTAAPEGYESRRILISPLIYSAQFRTPQQDPSNDWAPPPPPPPEERLPKRSKLDDLVEAECGIKSLGFAQTKQFNTAPYRLLTLQDERDVLQSMEMQQVRLAQLEHTKVEAAVAQKAPEEHVLEEAAAAAEGQSKEE